MFTPIEKYCNGSVEINNLLLKASHNKYRKTMDLEVSPVGVTECGYRRIYDFSQNPLTSGIILAQIPMPRKNQKRIDAAQADLNGMATKIADLWNKRDFDGIKALFS